MVPVPTGPEPYSYAPSVLQTAYQIIRPLTSGGMSNLWLVRDLACNRMAIMKTVSSDVRDDPMSGDRFKAENRILARLSHPNIVQLYGVFIFAEKRAMIMEMVNGVTLTEHRKQATLPLAEAVDIILQVLSALSYAHSQGVTHRDIKPANLMVTEEGQVKLVDFGISKCVLEPDRTYPGTTMGSAFYMAPEQILGMKIDSRCDLYSVGIIFYELMTGQRPFRSETGYGVMEQHLKSTAMSPELLNPSVPRSISRIILKAIAKNPDERYQSADEFAEAIGHAYRSPRSASKRLSQSTALVVYQDRKPIRIVRIRITHPGWIAPIVRTVCRSLGSDQKHHDTVTRNRSRVITTLFS